MKEKESTSKLKEETKQAVMETENSGIYPELQEKLNTVILNFLSLALREIIQCEKRTQEARGLY